jgi:cobalamin biosynthesis Mg chelatase CobN
MGLEPTTFCMASRRSSQLSYIREGAQSSSGPRSSPVAAGRRRQRGAGGEIESANSPTKGASVSIWLLILIIVLVLLAVGFFGRGRFSR